MCRKSKSDQPPAVRLSRVASAAVTTVEMRGRARNRSRSPESSASAGDTTIAFPIDPPPTVAITLDDDLQNPPEEIPRLLAALEEGADGGSEGTTGGVVRSVAGRRVGGVHRPASPGTVGRRCGHLVRGGAKTELEGKIPYQRIVVTEYPDVEAAKRFYNSPEYQEARSKRLGGADFNMIIVEGA